MGTRRPMDAALRRLLDEQAAAAQRGAQPGTDEERKELMRARMLQALASRVSIPGLPNGVQAREVRITEALAGRLYMPTSPSAAAMVTPGGRSQSTADMPSDTSRDTLAGTPSGGAPLPVLVYLHGGGWVAGSVETHDPFCRLLSEAAQWMVLSVEYRRAPESPYPAAVEDALAAVGWAKRHAAEWGGDGVRVALGGDSSGANLAAVAANQLCTQEAAAVWALLLLYPVLDHPSAGHASYTENVGNGLDPELMRWFWRQYAGAASPEDPGVSPLRIGSLPELPPTLVATAEYDLMRDEGLAYVERLRAAGVAVTHRHAPDMHHNFPVNPATVARFPQSEGALAEIAGWLRGIGSPRRSAIEQGR